jgi:hypothetical protein
MDRSLRIALLDADAFKTRMWILEVINKGFKEVKILFPLLFDTVVLTTQVQEAVPFTLLGHSIPALAVEAVVAVA